MAAPKENKHATKPAAERAESFLHIRCRQADKAAWVRAAKGSTLAQWVVDALNEKAGNK